MSKRRTQYEAGGEPSPVSEPAQADESSVYARGQTVIPKAIREALAIESGTRLHWELREGVIHVIPIPQNPITALRGILRGTGITYEWFMQERQREREQEQRWEQEHSGQLTRKPDAPGSS